VLSKVMVEATSDLYRKVSFSIHVLKTCIERSGFIVQSSDL